MPEIEVFTSDFKYPRISDTVVAALTKSFNLPLSVRKTERDLREFYNPERNQYDATQILQYYETQIRKEKALLLTSVDIYLPIFTHVFGLAKLGGAIAIVSTHRLDDQFYGLPVDTEKLLTRILKETTHELGHLFNLRHCENYQCVMASSTTADDLDIKQADFCSSCYSSLTTELDSLRI